jgi:hypothetical protein
VTARRLLCMLSVVLFGAQPAVAGAQAPPGPPGPPPGNGGDLPAAPGTAPGFVAPGTPAAIPAGASGPGLLSGAGAAFDRTRRTIALTFACQANGTVTVTTPAASSRALARSPYRCSGQRATSALRVSPKAAHRLGRHATTSATATVRQAGKAFRRSFVLRVGRTTLPAKRFWTDGHLQCADASGGLNAYLVQPDFTTASPTPISTRGWVAWYTAGSGWHWLGVGGENANRWDAWTATPGGIAQFHPGGAASPVPWTWGPISVPAGQGVYAVGVYEIVYWVAGHPDYQWQYVNAGTTGAAAAGRGSPYCGY